MLRKPRLFPPTISFNAFSSKSPKTLALAQHQIPTPTGPPAESILSLLSSAAASSDRPRDLGALLRPFRRSLDSNVVFSVLKHHKLLGPSGTLDFFSWAAPQLEFRFDDPVVEFMVDFLGRRKLFDDLRMLLKAVFSSKGRVSSRSVAIAIRYLGRHGRVVEAMEVFDTMEAELGCSPDNLVFNNVLYVLCRIDSSVDSVDLAMGILCRIGKPDAFAYSNVLLGLCRFGRVENALEVFDEMCRGNLVPMKSAANALIRGLCDVGGGEELIGRIRVKNCRRPFSVLVPNLGANRVVKTALEVFWVIFNSGLLPSLYVVNQLVSELCRLGNVEEAVEMVNLIENRNFKCGEESYTMVIQALCEARRMDEACDLFGRMSLQGLKPKVAVYNSVICAFCTLGMEEQAEKYYLTMNKRRCEPDCVTYTMLIHAYCKVNKWEKAYELLIEMIGMGLHPHFNTYNLVDGILKGNDKCDLSINLLRKMEVQRLQAYCKAGRLEDAYHKLCSMLDKGFRPPIYVRDTFERAFQNAGKWKIALELLEKMDQVAIQCNAQA